MKTMTLLAVAAVAVAQSNPKNYECTPAQLQAAIAPVAAVAVNTVVQCAQDANLSDQNVAAPTQLTSAQVTALLQSTSCAALYAGVQKAIASITPACFVFTQPVPVTSDKITDLSYQAYLEALQGGSLATGAPPPGAWQQCTTKRDHKTGWQRHGGRVNACGQRNGNVDACGERDGNINAWGHNGNQRQPLSSHNFIASNHGGTQAIVERGCLCTKPPAFL
uniref:Secreted protein n=1 Tax=Achlya hypogyna TaxID=1202772 RepID=A0A0A7CMW0_ACHHY|nr:secreted protein [Achlya hypogyna]